MRKRNRPNPFPQTGPQQPTPSGRSQRTTSRLLRDTDYATLEPRYLLAWEVDLNTVNTVWFYGPQDVSNNLTLSADESGYAQHNLPLSGNLVSALDLDSSEPGEQKRLATEVAINIGCHGPAHINASGWSTSGLIIGGSAYADLIVASTNSDWVNGGQGDDIIWGLDGDDHLFGDWGNDIIYGGSGNDDLHAGAHSVDDPGGMIFGEAGDDEITLGLGRDEANGGEGFDSLVDQVAYDAVLTDLDYTNDGFTLHSHEFERVYLSGTDNANVLDASAWTLSPLIIYGNGGNDTLLGGSQNDWIYGSYGNDFISGGEGDDQLGGEEGDDTLFGNGGNDAINGDLPDYANSSEVGNDELHGDAGDDLVVARFGVDMVFGGAGTDRLSDIVPGNAILTNSLYVAEGASSPNHGFESVTLKGTNEANLLDASAWTLSGLYLYGNGGDDILLGGNGPDVIQGGDGNDTLEGFAGNDSLSGGNDNDLLRGGSGENAIDGDPGDDSIFVSGKDSVAGGSGNDTLYGDNVQNNWILNSTNIGQLNGFNFYDIENIRGGSSADTLTIQNSGSLSGDIDLGDGPDNVNLQQYSGPVTLQKNGLAWSVLGHTGLISNVENYVGNYHAEAKVVGDATPTNWKLSNRNSFTASRTRFSRFRSLEAGNAGDTLSSPSNPTTWNLMGNNSGTVALAGSSYTFHEFANLSGGLDSDTLIINPGGTLSGTFNGGGGSNAVDYSAWNTGVSVNLNTSATGSATAIAGSVLNVTTAIGGAGNDVLTGSGSRANLLIGNAGNDLLTGGSDRDLLCGGLGSDTLSGGSGDDLLIGGFTSYDDDLIALRAIQAEWQTNARAFQQRSDNIYGTGSGTRLNGSYFLNNSTVFDDGESDTATGGNGQDWFFAQLAEITDFVPGGLNPDRRN